MREVVEDDEELSLAEARRDLIEERLFATGVQPERGGDRRADAGDVVYVREADEVDSVGVFGGQVVGELESEAGLADAGRPRDGDEPRAALEQLLRLGELAAPADEAAGGQGKARTGCRRRSKHGIVVEDRALLRAQIRPGLETELFMKEVAQLGIRLERLGLPPRPVEREHEPRAQPFPEWIVHDEGLELRAQLAVPSQREVGRDPLLERLQPKLVQPVGLTLDERFVSKLGERRAAPERERLAEVGRCPLWTPRSELSLAFREQVREPREIELALVDEEPVPARLGQQPVGAEPLAQLGEMLLQRVERRHRRPLDPQLLDQASCRDQLVRMQEQQREESALLSPAERDWTFTIRDLEWPEDMELRRNRSTSKRQELSPKLAPPGRSCVRKFVSGGRFSANLASRVSPLTRTVSL